MREREGGRERESKRKGMWCTGRKEERMWEGRMGEENGERERGRERE